MTRMHFFMYQSAPSIVFEILIFSKNHENKADNARRWLGMNAEDNLDLFGTQVVHTNAPETIFAKSEVIIWQSADWWFWKKSLFFRDTRHNQQHDAKNRLSISSPSSEKLLAEVESVKKNWPNFYNYSSAILRLKTTDMITLTLVVLEISLK